VIFTEQSLKSLAGWGSNIGAAARATARYPIKPTIPIGALSCMWIERSAQIDHDVKVGLPHSVGLPSSLP
jgi:hypothetical protein